MTTWTLTIHEKLGPKYSFFIGIAVKYPHCLSVQTLLTSKDSWLLYLVVPEERVDEQKFLVYDKKKF